MADVQGLYPNVSRKLIKDSLSNFTKHVAKTLIDLTIFCLENKW